MKVFQRAIQYNDPKKIHLALLEMFERTEQHSLADELLNKMTKKFKHSCKVLLQLKIYISYLCMYMYMYYGTYFTMGCRFG